MLGLRAAGLAALLAVSGLGVHASAPAIAGALLDGQLAWQRLPIDVAIAGGAGPDLVLSDIVRVPGGLVSVGADRRGGVVLRSTDGMRWIRQPDDPSFDQTFLVAAARGKAATILVARNRQRVWTSTDLVTWRTSGLSGSTSTIGVAASPSAYVVAGTYRLPPDPSGVRRLVPAVWASTDVTRWDRILLPSLPGAGDIRPALVRWVGTRFVLFARFDGVMQAASALTWTSPDGIHWTRGHGIALGRDDALTDLTSLRDGSLLASGSTAGTGAALWRSTDGLTWTRLPDGPGFTGASLGGVACAADQGCVAVGSTQGPVPTEARAWTSPDGVSWSASSGGGLAGDIGLKRVAITDERVVSIGWARTPLRDGSAVNAGAFWISPPAQLPDPIPPRPVPVISGSWHSVAPMLVIRTNPVATLGVDGRVYVFGGRSRLTGSTRTFESTSMEIYDPRSDTWTEGPTIPGPGRTRAAAVTAADGRIYLFHRSNPLVLIYDSAGRTWTTGPAVPGGRYVASAVRGPGQTIYVAASRTTPLGLFVLDTATGRWAERAGLDQVPCALGADGTLYATGPWRAYAIDRRTGATRPRAPTPDLVYGPAILGPGGMVWVVGYAYEYPAPGWTGRWMGSAVQAWDPATNTWSIGPAAVAPRYAHALVAAGDRIYAVGGSAGGSTNSVEVLIVDAGGAAP